MRRMKKTLSNRISSLIMAISMILALVFFALILNLNGFSQKRELAQINHFLDALLIQKKETIANEIFSDQREALTETLGHFADNEVVVSGTIYSTDGEELSSVGEQFRESAFEYIDKTSRRSTFERARIENRDLAIYSSPISLAGEDFGYIRLFYDISPIMEHSRNMSIMILLLLAIKTTALILILNIKLKAVVVDPIQRLERDMQRISDGDFDMDIAEFQTYEIDQMKNTFNSMAQSLKETQDNLEFMVNKRTKELTDSKKILSVVIDTMPTPVFYKDRYSRYTGCNNAFAELLDKSKEEIVGKTIFDLMEKKYAEPIDRKESEMLKNPKSQSYEGKFKTVYGLKDVLINKASIVSESGDVDGLVAVMSDITYRKEMEMELKYNSSFQELIAEVSSDFISMDKRSIDEKIMEMLKSIGGFFKSDRAYLYREIEGDVYANTHEWCTDGMMPSGGMEMRKQDYPCFESMIMKKEPLVINDLDEIPKVMDLEIDALERFCVKAFLGIPIVMGGRPEGLLGISMVNSGRTWKRKEISLLKVMANVLTDALERKSIEDQLKKSNRELKKLSVTDKLTQLYNRLKTDEVLEYELTQAKRSKTVFSIALFDIDRFKDINDTYGHNIGDRVLVELSDVLRKCSRKTDTIGRWGGEEFIAIFPETDLDGAIIAAEKIRKSIEDHKFEEVGKVTCSFGVTESEKSDTGSSIVARVDEALYRAKNNGRNRVEFK